MLRVSPILGVFGILYFLMALVCVVAFVWVAALLIQFLTLKNRQLRAGLYRAESEGRRWGHRQGGSGYPAEQPGQQWPGQQPPRPPANPPPPA